jgi:hypothetical protein
VRRRAPLLLLATLPLLLALLITQGAPAKQQGGVRFVLDETSIADCRAIAARGEDPVPCYRQALANTAALEGPASGLATLRQEWERVTELYGGCHPLTHSIGAAGLEYFGGDVGAAFAAGDDTCASGYYHGVVERVFLDVPLDEASLWGIAGPLCDPAAIRATAYLAIQCFHGLGHGLMLATDYDLPLSAAICAKYPDELGVTSCYLGLFMENFNASYGVTSPWVVDGDLGSTCASLSGRHSEIAKGACYNAIIYRLAARSERQAPWSEYLSLCASIDPAYAGACYNGFGREVYTRYAVDFSSQIAAMRAACLLAPPAGVLSCVMGVAGHVSYTDSGGERAAGFCNEFEGEYRGGCFKEIGDLLSSLGGGAAAVYERCALIAVRPVDLASCLADEPRS